MLGGKLFHCHLASKWYTFRVSFTSVNLMVRGQEGFIQRLLGSTRIIVHRLLFI
jgi:hypothetical protein